MRELLLLGLFAALLVGCKEKEDDPIYRVIERSPEIAPNYAPAYWGRALIRAQCGDMKGAKEDIDRALQIDPNYVPEFIEELRNKEGD